MKWLFNAYVFGNIHVALASASLTYLTILLGDVKNFTPVLIVFFSTLTTYNLIRLISIKDNSKNDILIWSSKNIVLFYILFFVSSLAILLLIFRLKIISISLLFFLGLLSFFYLYPIPSFPKGLRSVKGLKIIIVGLVWSLSSVAFPFLELGIEPSFSTFLLVLENFLFVILLTIPFEVRDLKYDSDILNTIPQVFGIKGTKTIALVIFITLLLLTFLNYYFKSIRWLLLIDIFVYVLSYLAVYFIDEKVKLYYCSFWVEAIPVLKCFLYILFFTVFF